MSAKKEGAGLVQMQISAEKKRGRLPWGPMQESIFHYSSMFCGSPLWVMLMPRYNYLSFINLRDWCHRN